MPTLVHITDLHLDHWPQNFAAMRDLVAVEPADVYLIGGDNGGESGIKKTVCYLRELRPQAAIAWVMGNHDLWNHSYTHVWSSFPDVAATYLEIENLETSFCTIVGTYGHYDYSGGTPELSHEAYESFTDGKQIWNDRFIDRAGKTNPQIAAELAARFRQRYEAAAGRRLPIVVLTHTWPFAPPAERRSFVAAYCCNQMIGDILLAAPVRPAVLFCGHTHRPARLDDFGFPMINTGSDYNCVRVTKWELAAA